MLTSDTFFDLTDFPHPLLLPRDAYVWEGLNLLKEYMDDYPYQSIYSKLLKEHTPLTRTLILYNGDIMDSEDFTVVLGKTIDGETKVYLKDELLPGASVLMAGSCFSGNKIEIGKGVLIEPGAMLKSPAIIGNCNEVRQGAYLRGYALSGKGCVLGHSTEIKHAIFLNDAKAGHFNYIGDSILGNNTNLGAGTKIANLRFIDGNITIHYAEKLIDTGRKKFGAILGDNSQTGCNSVTSPGTILGKECFLMPNFTARSGVHPAASVIR